MTKEQREALHRIQMNVALGASPKELVWILVATAALLLVLKLLFEGAL